MILLTHPSALIHTARRVLATRIVTPAQEYAINQLLWQTDLNDFETDILDRLLTGLVEGQIIVLSELGRSQQLAPEIAVFTGEEDKMSQALEFVADS